MTASLAMCERSEPRQTGSATRASWPFRKSCGLVLASLAGLVSLTLILTGCTRGATSASASNAAPADRASTRGFSASAPFLTEAMGQTVHTLTDASPNAAIEQPLQPRALTTQELTMARMAWRYVENNYHVRTGLVNSVDGYPSTTMWDVSSQLAAFTAAYELHLISQDVFDQRLSAFLHTLNHLALFRNELPNKAYNTATGEKDNYSGQPGDLGYSALDLGRLLIWLKILKERYPSYSDAIDSAVLRWNFCHVLDRWGTMYGAMLGPEQQTLYVQEGRLGYEEYAAKGFQVWGFNTTRASRPEPYGVLAIYGIKIPYDQRDPRTFKAHNSMVSENFILDALEFNWDVASDRDSGDAHHSDRWTAEIAERMYRVQEARYRATDILTARTEHHVHLPPFFVYDSILSSGQRWSTITEQGQHMPQFAAVAVKAALGLWAIWQTEYTALLFSTVSGLYDPTRGYFEGLYENDGAPIQVFTLNTNGTILETLLHKVQGKLLRLSHRPSLWDKAIDDRLQREGQCLPQSAPGSDQRPAVSAR